MATPTIWISLEDNHVEIDGTHPGDHWEEVGVIDSSTETDFYSHIQSAIGVRQTAKGRPDFYMSGDPKSRWVEQCERNPTGQKPFWILLNPYGDTRIHLGTRSIKYLLSADKATVVRTLTRRPPIAHPGLREGPIMVGIRMRRHNGELFESLRTDGPP